MTILYALLFALAFAICYHGRGGSFFSFKNGDYPHLFGLDENGTPYFNYGGDIAARLIWWVLPVTAITFFMIKMFVPALLLIAAPAFLAWLGVYFIPAIFAVYGILLYVNLLILSHGPYQSFGTDVAQTKSTFLTFWLPKYDASTPLVDKELLDFVGLFIVGAGRGFIQAIPLSLLSAKFFMLVPFGAAMALAYLVGRKFLNNVIKIQYFSGATDIGELGTGFFYGLGTAVLLLFS